MTQIKVVEMGEDIKALMKSNTDVSNMSNVVDTESLDDDELYLLTKHIGFYDKVNKSGIFILDILHITDEVIEKSF